MSPRPPSPSRSNWNVPPAAPGPNGPPGPAPPGE